MASRLGKRSTSGLAPEPSSLQPQPPSQSQPQPQAQQPPLPSPHGYRLPSHFASNIIRRSSPLRGGGDGPGSSTDFDKEHKIRIVERLGTVKYALGQEDPAGWHHAPGGFAALQSAALGGALPYSPRSSPRPFDMSSSGPGTGSASGSSNTGHPLQGDVSMTGAGSASGAGGGVGGAGGGPGGGAGLAGGDAVQWLDDQELSELSTEELEVLMDRYIMEVVKQLVQLAALDDDLRAEIDSLDTSGFSLLHYCCLYNLNSLIPVLLARGADVNRRTSTGSTALHLAAGAGHLAVTQVLVESGAAVDSYDANSILPSDAAYEAGYMDIYNLLLSVSLSYDCSPSYSSHFYERVCSRASSCEKKGSSCYVCCVDLMSVPCNVLIILQLENRHPLPHRGPSMAAEVTSEMVDANNTMIAENRALYGSTNLTSSPQLHHQQHQHPLHHLTFSPTASGSAGKSALDMPSLKFDSPPPAFPTEIHDPAAMASNLEGASALSNKLLHEAFASLSLTDKCALSLTMSQLNRYSLPLLPFRLRRVRWMCEKSQFATIYGGCAGHNLSMALVDLSATTSVHALCRYSTGSASEVPVGSAKGSTGNSRMSTPRTSKIGAVALGFSPLDSTALNVGAGVAAGAGAITDDISEIQSVLSETDKESLDVAMSMMGHLELRQVEDEVGS